MACRPILFILMALFALTGCFRTEKSPEKKVSQGTPVAASISKPTASPKNETPKDRILNQLTKYFDQADAIHREAWWVLSEERRPVGKSPFGKVHRALLSSQNIKLSNKSLFRCDRYVVQRDVMALGGYPQKAEIFEKCSEKQAAKKIADYFAPKAHEVQVNFYPENLEEILGLGATILNRTIRCSLRGNDQDQLVALSCKDWAQERSQEHMIRLDVYDYEMSGRNIIKLRGKVFENLTDTRKIEADVPLEGKIFVTETELYPEEPAPTPAAKPSPAVAKTPLPGVTPPMLIPPPMEGDSYQGGGVQFTQPQPIDPDILKMRQNNQQMGQGTSPLAPVVPINPNSPPGFVPEQEGSSAEQQNSQTQPGLMGPIDPNTGLPIDGYYEGEEPIPSEEEIRPIEIQQQQVPPEQPAAGGVYGR